MKKLFLIIACLYVITASSQVPFATYKKPTVETMKKRVARASGFSDSDYTKALIDSVNKEVEDIDRADFFDHANANVVSIQNGKKLFPTINGEVINYKLSLWTTTADDGSKRPHYLPLSIITKVSGDYADSSAGPVNDAVSYFGAPLTFRFSPAFELTKATATENKLFLGVNTDLRLLTIADAVTSKLNVSWGAYGSIGLTYMGKGYAFETDESERFDGKWSFTTLLYFFKSGGEFNKAVLGDYEKKTLSGVELLLRFKTNRKEDSKFNFLIGASNGFTSNAPNFAKWEFRIGVGN